MPIRNGGFPFSSCSALNCSSALTILSAAWIVWSHALRDSGESADVREKNRESPVVADQHLFWILKKLGDEVLGHVLLENIADALFFLLREHSVKRVTLDLIVCALQFVDHQVEGVKSVPKVVD